MTDDSMMTAADPASVVADVTALRRWLRERDDEVAIFQRTLDKRDAEIERLRAAEKMMVEQFLDQEREATAQAKEIERLRGELDAAALEVLRLERLVWTPMDAYAEIEQLRGLLREIGDIGWLQAPHPLTKRVREALGND